MAIDLNEKPVAVKSKKSKQPPVEAEKEAEKPLINLHPFACEITSVKAKSKKIEVTLVLNDFPVIEHELGSVFGRVNDKGGIEDSALAIFGHLHSEGRILMLQGATANIKED